MIYPSIDKLLTKVDNKYSLVVIAARRSRELLAGSEKLLESRGKKTVGTALEEVMGDKITYRRLVENKLK
ncbi:DNA-directed RNA polymerase subunit omega [Alkalicella caledoniensis]|uniref:DNA-directed RNA polymerase subunit omega n=1 Tax=Alkalicella caledoniensis TaxID=2731377 RepID=A0A7G9WCC7_ALKCA|nr:DNA-directed RNA polymerase subunit omega [Alkalicella caledoniensis]QNO16339.1 DNA-directed RNA polymerase subunit omega [Alkalicella caledoniensis]